MDKRKKIDLPFLQHQAPVTRGFLFVGGWVDFSVRNLYRQLIQYSVEQRIKKLERQGQNFNREKIVKEMEAVNPIAIFMAFGALIWFVDDSFNFGMFNLFLPYLLIIFYALILIGLNHYFGWIRLKK